MERNRSRAAAQPRSRAAAQPHFVPLAYLLTA